ncbi:MAG: ABC transporter ATP-binding protein [Pseudorhodoplanes sp.]|nr:putative siderophore transport system ATP-binding protein YusV [Pseudorhodoplanes sp.]MBW7949023.1 ABC transporter ATP-binding protein [Pseudorhodoplanes sp.]
MTAIVTAENLSVVIGHAKVVDAATFRLARGTFTALVGPNGAGKTTLMRALAGLIPAEGTVTIEGRTLASMPGRERARTLAYLPQGAVFHWPLRVDALVALGRYPHGDALSSPTPDDRRAVEAALTATATAQFAARPVTTLSGGERARVALARALATQAPVLLADEPTVSLDARHQLVVMQLLQKAARNGAAVLTVVHDLTLAARFADRVLMMRGGRVVAEGDTASVLQPEWIAEVFGVEPAMLALDGVQLPLPRRPL